MLNIILIEADIIRKLKNQLKKLKFSNNELKSQYIQDICRQISKETIHPLIKTKVLMENKETLMMFFKVWNAYTKYIKTQCVQNRCFVSPFIGSFMQSSTDSKFYQFIPNKEFIDAGKFKYNERLETDKADDQKDLNKNANLPIDCEIDKIPIIQMSASSIAQVCGITRSQVLEILKEIFAKVVELSKNKDEIILDLRIGELCITDRKELVFKNKDKESSKTNKKIEIIKALKETDYNKNNNYVPPYDVNKIASDILSMHSGSSYYVSVSTPKTKARSVISSRMNGSGSRKRGQQWSFFK